MSETQIRPAHDNSAATVLERTSYYDALLDNYAQPPSQNQDAFETLENVEMRDDGALRRRRGYTAFAGLNSARRIFEAHDDTGRNRLVLTAANGTGVSSSENDVSVVNESGATVFSPLFTPAASAAHPIATTSRSDVYFCDGVAADLKKWDLVDSPTGKVTMIGFRQRQGAGFVVAPIATGNVVLNAKRTYAVIFYNNNTKHAALLTKNQVDPNDSSQDDQAVYYASFGPSATVLYGSSVQVQLTGIPTYNVATDAPGGGSGGYTSTDFIRIIVATADGGSTDTLYEVGRILNNVDTTFTDNVSENTLLASQVWAQLDASGIEVGVHDNVRPARTAPSLTQIITHRGRLFGLTDQFLFWTKNLAEVMTGTNTPAGRYEECWPPAYQMPISIQAEFGRAILSDGINLYIGTDRGVRVLSGDYPNFIGPRTLFHEVGVMRPDVWRIVFHEGRQVGAIWLTPDKRVIASDFNTYGDIGRPIQTTLNSMNVARAAVTANAIFVSDGAYEYYMLAIPTAAGGAAEPDTLCVFDLNRKQWRIWKPSDTVFSQGFMQDVTNRRTLWLFGTTPSQVYRWFTTNAELETAANYRDRVSGVPVSYACTITTTWLHWNLPQVTKFLNDLEVQTADTALTVKIEGASTDAQFTAPVTVLAATALTVAPFGQYKKALAGLSTKFRFYRFTFTSPASTVQVLLRYFAVEGIPIHRF